MMNFCGQVWLAGFGSEWKGFGHRAEAQGRGEQREQTDKDTHR